MFRVRMSSGKRNVKMGSIIWNMTTPMVLLWLYLKHLKGRQLLLTDTKRLDHSFPDRYRQISHKRTNVPTFSPSTTRAHECARWFRSKMKKSPITLSRSKWKKQCNEINYDISDLLSPSLGGNIYASHFIEPTTLKYGVFFFKAKFDLATIVINSVLLSRLDYPALVTVLDILDVKTLVNIYQKILWSAMLREA